MDQNKTDLPHFRQATKASEKLETLPVHVTGALVHGIGAFGFFENGEYGRGANLVSSIFLSILEKLSQRGPLPKTLYLQMDNAGENKNQYMLALCWYLVERNVFNEIEISFLIVGHTHEDIDQLFSCFSRYLKVHDALTLPQLMTVMGNCYTPSPQCYPVDAVYDIKQWLIPHMQPISRITGPHIFRIHHNDSGKAELTFKELSTDEKWMICELTSEQNPYILQDLPRLDDIQEVPLNYSKLGIEKDDGARLKGIRNQLDDYQACLSHIDPDAFAWWETFLTDTDQKSGHVELRKDTPPICRLLSPSICSPDPPQHRNLEEPEPENEMSIRPVKIGRGARKFAVKEMLSDVINLMYKVGEFILLDCRGLGSGYQDWPHIGEVRAVSEEMVTILWYRKGRGGKYEVYTEPIGEKPGSKRKQSVGLEEKLSKHLVISDGFDLCFKSNEMPKKAHAAVKEYLKHNPTTSHMADGRANAEIQDKRREKRGRRHQTNQTEQLPT